MAWDHKVRIPWVVAMIALLGGASCAPIDDAGMAVAGAGRGQTEAWDTLAEFDTPLDTREQERAHVECGPVRHEIYLRRTPEQREEAHRTLTWLRRHPHHRHVPLEKLVAFIRPIAGAPDTPAKRAVVDRGIAMMLCDALYRESVIRAYLPLHREYVTAEVIR